MYNSMEKDISKTPERNVQVSESKKGNITLSGTTGYVTPSFTSISPGTTTSTVWFNNADPKSGTDAKNKIKESLKKLATTA